MTTTTVQCFKSTTGFTTQIAAHMHFSEAGSFQPKAPKQAGVLNTLKEDSTAPIQLPTCG